MELSTPRLRRLWPHVGALAASLVGSQSSEQVLVTGTVLTCSNAAPKASYGPLRKFDGVMFSFIDGVVFTPCRKGQRCDAQMKANSLDLEAEHGAWSHMNENDFKGWGYYRLAFQGRLGRYDTSRFCNLGSQEFYKVEQVLSFKRIPDPRYP